MRILATLPIQNSIKGGICAITICAAIIFGGWCLAAFLDEQSTRNRIISTILAIIFVIASFIAFAKIPYFKPDKYRYYIEITDKDNKTEILNSYILENVIGDIYVIRDK